MTPKRKRKMGLLLFILLAIAIVVALVLYALRQNISLFYTPTQIVEGAARNVHAIRAGGMVVPGSIIRQADGLTVRFKVTDYKHTITIRYHGVLPDLFREGQGIVAQGELIDNHELNAKTVFAKHDEKYMPPEVSDALKKAKVS